MDRPPAKPAPRSGERESRLASLKLFSRREEKPPTRKKGWTKWSQEALTWALQDAPPQRWLLVIVLSAVLSLLLVPQSSLDLHRLREGDVLARDIKANRTYQYEDPLATEERRREAAAAVPTVYDHDTWLDEVMINRVREAFELARVKLRLSAKTPIDETGGISPIERAIKAEFESALGEGIRDRHWFGLKRARFSSEMEGAVVKLLQSVLFNEIVANREDLLEDQNRGIVIRSLPSRQERLVRDLSTFLDVPGAIRQIGALSFNLLDLPRGLRPLAAELATALVRPDLTLNRAETDKRRHQAREGIKSVIHQVIRGETVAREGQVITVQILARLKAEAGHRQKQQVWVRIGGMFLLLLVFFRCIYLPGIFRRNSQRIDGRDLIFIAATIVFVFSLVKVSQPILTELARGISATFSQGMAPALPVAVGALLICSFLGLEAALLTSLVTSFLAAYLSEFRLETFALYLTSSLVGARAIFLRHNRGATLRAGFLAGLAGMAMAGVTRLVEVEFFRLATLSEMGAGLLGGLLSGIIVSGLIPLVESLFGYTTDLKLLELANLDQPYLKEFLFQAPGSYHHSVVVGNMVETAAEAIGANPLLAKVAAYYHDVGKIKKPQYFIENQQGVENKHDKLAPSMSALILIAHVKEGVEIARQAKLGKLIEDIIAQHHGTSLIKYFYDKALKQKSDKEQVNEEDFRYPGPKPQTREAGLIMLADQVEAASKTLAEPTPARIQHLVSQIINRIFIDGQLSDCELTLKDLNAIAKSFNKVLTGIFHTRVAYPEPPTRPGPAKKKTNGDSDSKRPDKGPTQPNEPAAEDGDNLKRLGIS